MMLVTCRCGATLMPSAPSCGRCGARPLATTPATPALVGVAPAMPAQRPRPPAPMVTRVAPAPPFAPHPPAPHPFTAHPFAAPQLAPAPASRPGPTALTVGLLVGLAVLALLLAGGVTYLLLRPAPAVAAPAPVVVTAPAASGTSAATTSDASSDSSGSGPSGSSTDTEESSAALLDEGVTRDRSSVETVTGSWVPQLSAKKVGTVADGRAYDSTDILRHYNELRDRVPGAMLLWSGDWPVFTEDDYWVVVAPTSFATPAAANAWCDAEGFGADDCMAKRLSHSGGPSGTTVPRS